MRMKRNKKMKKYYKQDLRALDYMLGEADAALAIHLLLCSLNKVVEGKESLGLRSLGVTVNDFFTTKFDFKTCEVSEE